MPATFLWSLLTWVNCMYQITNTYSSSANIDSHLQMTSSDTSSELQIKVAWLRFSWLQEGVSSYHHPDMSQNTDFSNQQITKQRYATSSRPKQLVCKHLHVKKVLLWRQTLTSLLLTEKLASVCRQVGILHANYSEPQQCATKANTRRFLSTCQPGNTHLSNRRSFSDPSDWRVVSRPVWLRS